MATVRICDLCHEKILEGDNPRKFRVKIQERKTHINFIDREAWCSWETIDAHSGCVLRLFEKTKPETTRKSGD